MWSTLLGRALSSSSSRIAHQWKNLASSSSLINRHFSSPAFNSNDSNGVNKNKELLSLAEIEKVLKDVGAHDVQVFAAPNRCEFTDHMVIATGPSPWHVRNICQALIYKVKQKQKGAKRMPLPTVVGQEGGKWIVIDFGPLIVHAVDEKTRAYYNLEGLWTTDTSKAEHTQDLKKAFVKVRRKNNSKKPSQART